VDLPRAVTFKRLPAMGDWTRSMFSASNPECRELEHRFHPA
jgi:hypothetical protein